MKNVKREINSLIRKTICFVVIFATTVGMFGMNEVYASFESEYADGSIDYTYEYHDVKPPSTGDSSFTILEIVPDLRMSTIGYYFGGYEPLRIEEFDGEHDGDIEQSRLAKLSGFAMDGLGNRYTGYATKNDNAPYSSRINNDFHFASCGADVPSHVNVYGEYNGYFQKVAPGKGVYAISNKDSDVQKDYIKTSDGYSHYKMEGGVFKKSSSIYDYEENNYSKSKYDVTFKAEEKEDKKHQYYNVEKATNVGKNKGDYTKETKIVDYNPRDFYTYVGKNMGDWEVTFSPIDNYNPGWNNGFYVTDKIVLNENEGQYRPKASSLKCKKRPANDKFEEGFDYEYAVSNVVMASRFIDGGKNINGFGGFDYIWVDVDTSMDGKFTDAEEFGKHGEGLKYEKNNLEKGRIYLRNYHKAKVYCNEIFWTLIYSNSSMGDKVGVPGTDGTSAIYSVNQSNDKLTINTQNKDAVEGWLNSREINIVTMTPEMLREEDNKKWLEKAKFIILSATTASPTWESVGDWHSSQALQYYAALRGKEGTIQRMQDHDLDYNQMMTIYRRVAVDHTAALLASKYCTDGYSNVSSYYKKLMYMLYYLTDETADPSLGNTTKGSGRRVFCDFIPEMILAGKAYDYDSPNFEVNGEGENVDSVNMKYVYVRDDGNLIVNGGSEDYSRGGTTKNISWSSKDLASWDPANFDQRWLLEYDANNGGLKLELYYFYKGDKHNVSYSDNPDVGYYDNQAIYNNTGNIFKVMNNPSGEHAGWISKILSHLDDKSYLYLKITNFDATNNGSNKVMYINDYETVTSAASDKVVINFTIETSSPVQSIKVYRGTSTTGTAYGGTITTAGANKYKLYIPVSDIKDSSVNTFTIRASNGSDEAEDAITILVRDFFDIT